MTDTFVMLFNVNATDGSLQYILYTTYMHVLRNPSSHLCLANVTFRPAKKTAKYCFGTVQFRDQAAFQQFAADYYSLT